MTALLIVLTVVEILLFIGALAYYLVKITDSLERTTSALAKVSFGVRAIETQCEPIGPSVLRINEQLEAVAHALDDLAVKAGGSPRG